MKYSIKVRMTFLVAVIIVAMMGGMLLVSFFLAEPFMIGRQKANIMALYHSLESNYSDDAAELARLVRNYEEGNYLKAEIYDSAGSLIYTSGRKMTEGFGGIKETATMNEMIRSMLDVSALENGLRKLKTLPLELSEWLEELMERERPLLEKKGLRPEISITPGLRVEADPDYLTRAVMNILQNAQTHTVPGGRITVSLSAAAGEALFSVYNDGRQIPEDKLDKIWESFYKTDEARTRGEQNNVGLGLYIVRTIIAAHGGRCGAVNEENGVRFWITLPLNP